MADIEGESRVVEVITERPVKPGQAEAKDIICDRVSKGETLASICRDAGMPAVRTVYDWIDADSDFADRMNRAREKGYDAIAEETLEIADDGRNDWMEKYDKEGNSLGYLLNGEHVQRSKLRIETRLKLLAKWHPKKYGDKVDVNHGVQPENPLAVLLQQVQGSALPFGTEIEGEIIEDGDDE